MKLITVYGATQVDAGGNPSGKRIYFSNKADAIVVQESISMYPKGSPLVANEVEKETIKIYESVGEYTSRQTKAGKIRGKIEELEAQLAELEDDE